MIVKIGDIVYDSDEQPIMIVLEEHEKQDISSMFKEDYKYCCAPPTTTETEMVEFMRLKPKT